MKILPLIALSIIVGILVVLANYITGLSIGRLNKKLKDAVPELKTLERLAFYDKKEIKFIRNIFGCVEVWLFFVCTVFLLTFKNEQFEIAKSLLIVVSGWMAIKVVGNFKNWETGKDARIIYSIFLLGSITSTVLGISIAFLIHYLLRACSIE